MEDFIVYIVPDAKGGYLANTPLIPDEAIWGGTPDEAFAKMKVRAEKWIGNKGFEFAQIKFRVRQSPEEDAEFARAAHERGETQELDEAFAEIAGMEPADWRKKVATLGHSRKP
jgi:predicted RNase H-like HicB family nuclease